MDQKANTELQNVDGKTALDFCNDSIKKEPKLKKGEKPVKGSMLDKLLATRDALKKLANK